MECPKCHFDNPADSKYCQECGTKVFPSVTETVEAPKEELTTGSTFAGRYQIIEELGKGGMGKVYKANDTDIKEKVAIKLIKPEISTDKKTIERFQNELKFARKIRHKNVCQMYDLNREEGTYYITMEYVSGEDLKGFIRRSGQLAIGTTIRISKQVCEGLSEAHKLGVVHRDLKPSNIMIDKDGNARIMDFGIARSLEAKGITGAGVMIGTPEYMSPEQVEGKEVDQRSDIYSLGVILYEMVTGRIPFEGDTPFTIGMKHKGEMPKNPKELNTQIPDDLNSVILRCLEKDKEKRFQSTGEVRSELTNIEEGIPATERVVPEKKALTSKEVTVTFKRPLIWIVSMAVVVIVVVLGLLFLKGDRQGEESVPTPPLSEKKMLVVLPFENLGTPEDDYFADGMTEEITSRLAALHGLGVISRSSAIQYKKTNKPIKQIGEELGVDYVLEGTVRWDRGAEDKGRVRVTPQLIRVSDDTHLWSERYDRVIEDIFSVQAEIAVHVIKQLDLTLLEPERQALFEKPTDNLEAYDYLLRGRDLWRKALFYSDSMQGYEQAISMFRNAIELDPDLGQAYGMISFLHSWVYFAGLDKTRERLEKSKAAIDKALELRPEMPEAKAVLAMYYYRGFLDYDRALELLEQVQKARPNYPPDFIGYIQRRQGKWEKCLTNLGIAFKLNPRNAWLAYELAGTNSNMRRYDKAEVWVNRALSIDPRLLDAQLRKVILHILANGNAKEARASLETLPKNKHTDDLRIYVSTLGRNYQEVVDFIEYLPYDSFDAQNYYFNKYLTLASVYFTKNEIPLMITNAETARMELEKRVQERPDDPRFRAAFGLACAYSGRKQEAIEEGNRAVQLYPVSKDALDGPFYLLNLAKICAIVEEYEEAIDRLEYLMSIPAGEIISVHTLELEPSWDPLRSHPRFKRLLEKYSKKD